MRQEYVERMSARMRLGTCFRGPGIPAWSHYTDPDMQEIACGQSAWILGHLTGTLLGDVSTETAHAGLLLGLLLDE